MLSNLFRKEHSGWFVIVFLTAIPVIRWIQLLDLQYRFTNWTVGLTSVGDVLGIAGMMLFALTLIMSIRISFFEDFFGGMNKVYVIHHLVGSTAFVLLMMHPLMMTASYATISLRNAALFILPGTDWALGFGKAALLTMMVLLILTLFVKLPYHIWRKTHQFMGLAFLFATVHAYLIPADIAVDPFLRYYMLSFAALALVGYSYRTVLGKYLVKRHRYEVISVKRVGKEVVEIKMKPKDKPMHYRPGQFVFISFESENVSSEVHPFSLSSSPSQDTVTLSIKMLGDFTNKLPDLKIKTNALIEGPYGRFSYDLYNQRRQIWIAGGIGITPFLSMARTFRNLSLDVDLYYVVRDKADAVFIEELESIAKENPRFKLRLFETSKQGHLDPSTVEKMSGGIKNTEIFICGPPAMMYSFKQQLRSLSFPMRHVHSEEFQIQ